jgi:hypothetical protein
MGNAAMMQINQTSVAASDGAVATLREEFMETGCAFLPGFLAPGVLAPVLKSLETAVFSAKNEFGPQHGVFGTTMYMPRTEPALFALHFLLNRPGLFDLVEEITECGRPGNFLGRMHRTSAGTDQHIDWHDDVSDNRAVGLNIYLGVEPFSGGLFQIRDAEKTIRRELKFESPGDAFLFRIDRGWQHRLTRVESGTRTVGVGWFRTKPDRVTFSQAWFGPKISQPVTEVSK